MQRPVIPYAKVPVPLVFQLNDVQEMVLNDWDSTSRQAIQGFKVRPTPEEICQDSTYVPERGSGRKYGGDPPECWLLLFGCTEAGESVCVQVRYFPFFYVQVPAGFSGNQLISEFETRGLSGVKYTSEKKFRLDGWQSDPDQPKQRRAFQFLKLRFLSIMQMKQCQKLLRTQFPTLPMWETETVLKAALKFLDDRRAMAAGWMQVSSHKEPALYLTSCQIEVQATGMLACKPVEPAKLEIAPLLIASFDAEMKGSGTHFANAENPEDAVVGIGLTLQRLGETKPHAAHYFAFVAGVEKAGKREEEGYTLHYFPTEHDMLDAFRDAVVNMDPDVVIGYNINRFDWKYLGRRAKPGSRFFRFSRILMRETPIEEDYMTSAAFGENTEQHLHMPGRLQIDVMTYIKRHPNYKFRSYTLNAMSAYWLGTDHQKLDFTPAQINAAAEQGVDGAAQIGKYCIQDTILPLQLFTKLMVLPNTIEMSRLTSLFPQDVILRGQQQKIISYFYRVAHTEGFVFSRFEDTAVPDYEGATVIPPETGLYDGFVVTLDYSSLYPSILIANNLSPDTVKLDEGEQGDPKLFPATGDRFVQHVEGLLSKMERNLLAERKAVRAQMKCIKDATLLPILDGKQNAIKTVCNSIYGFTGAKTNIFNCPAVARTITAIGREMIMKTKHFIESSYDMRVIYGDTDSVFILLNVKDMAEAFKVGKEAAIAATAMFNNASIKLEFEKVMSPLLLMAKKRYVGMKTEDPNKPPVLYSKGLETVRRDVPIFIADTVTAVLDALLHEKDVMLAQKRLHQTLCDFEDKKIPIEKFAKSVQLKDKYKSTHALPQLVVARKMKDRNPGSEPLPGDRFSYVVIQDSKIAAVAERAEDPVYAKEHGLKPDYVYYLDLLEKAISRIFVAFTDQPEVLFQRTRAAHFQAEAKLQSIATIFGGKVDTERRMPRLQLKAQEPLKKRRKVAGPVPLTSFFTKKQPA